MDDPPPMLAHRASSRHQAARAHSHRLTHAEHSHHHDAEKTLRRRVQSKLREYFLAGQLREAKAEGYAPKYPNNWLYMRFIYERPRYVALLLPGLVFLSAWLMFAVSVPLEQSLGQFRERWPMTLVMIFGSLVAGGTSEGGGAIAFPFMTLVLALHPFVGRDFSLIIQSCGMTAGSFAIIYMRLRYERRAVLHGSIGGIIGIIFGLQYVAPRLPPPLTKMIFVSVWLGFAFSLWWLNRIRGRRVFDEVTLFSPWKAAALTVAGAIGGLVTAIAGSGIDIAVFSCLTLLFRVSEKVATPTSVILMTINTIVGVIVKGLFVLSPGNVSESIDSKTVPLDGEWAVYGLESEAVKYFIVAMPGVIFFSPLGAFLSSFVHRLVYSYFIYVLDVLQFITALIIVKQSWTTGIVTFCVVIVSAGSFLLLSRVGEHLMQRNVRELELLSAVATVTERDVELAVSGRRNSVGGGQIELLPASLERTPSMMPRMESVSVPHAPDESPPAAAAAAHDGAKPAAKRPRKRRGAAR